MPIRGSRRRRTCAGGERTVERNNMPFTPLPPVPLQLPYSAHSTSPHIHTRPSSTLCMLPCALLGNESRWGGAWLWLAAVQQKVEWRQGHREVGWCPVSHVLAPLPTTAMGVDRDPWPMGGQGYPCRPCDHGEPCNVLCLCCFFLLFFSSFCFSSPWAIFFFFLPSLFLASLSLPLPHSLPDPTLPRCTPSGFAHWDSHLFVVEFEGALFFFFVCKFFFFALAESS
ncbi:unnamed protein product [Mortierella alpina]